ncbi:E3 SUMO-protein ligase ZBED1-like isoform X6 [Epinephelus lanceolatus]|uniref:zinc finger BED domain-containing protein 1-like isoform X4 n=1 Tax=Epinephelus lanceolatus TaxID=310571 RepID=UPI0014472B4D|nr:zinc finger BED domain-containing protein 1-like isoform X4 [Epinephelus lanceolatus]
MAQASGACCEAKWVREHLSGSEEGNFTVRRRSDGRIPVVLCKDCKLYHSPFCQPSVYKPKGDYARVWTHVEIHRMRALQHGDNSTFFKQCPDCEMVYRYPEWSEGLHNYNDHIILSLQLCMLLQKSIENHTAVDGVVEVLERTEGVKSPCAIEVLQAYLHFEALTSHNCLSVVMMDLYQKGVFNMAGFEITGLSESSIGEVNAEELWDSVCMGIIRSSLVARRSSDVSTSEDNLKEAATSAVTTLLIPAARKRLTKQRTEECHKAVTRYLVKELHPLSTVDSSWFREMAKMLNPKYQLPSRDQLMNTLMPSWYSVEKNHVIKELLQVSEAAVTCDWWTSFAQDRYLTVTLHFIIKGQMRHKVLRTKPVYDVQADTAVAEQIGGILEEFGVRDKVVAVTVDNGSSMDVAIKKSQFRKLGCFAQILSLAAQKVYFSITVTRWASRIRAVVVWIKRSSTAQTVLREKQQLLNLPQHYLVLDVRTRWGSFYLMIERFAEQYAAIQATITDPQIKQSVERLETLTDDDHQKAEELIRIMKPLYMSSLCVSADKSPTCSQIFPILKKMTANFETQDEDSLFTASLKEKARDDLSACYKMMILGSSYRSRAPWIQGSRTESTQMRFGTECKMLRLQPQQRCQIRRNTNFGMRTEMLRMYLSKTSIQMRQRLTGLEELFEDEDRALKSITEAEKTPIAERVQQEIQLYRSLPAVPTSEDALAWWWRRRDSLPLLSQLSNSYLCIQASSTPRERVFSTAGDTISRERSHILPEQADMQIFLQKNC